MPFRIHSRCSAAIRRAGTALMFGLFHPEQIIQWDKPRAPRMAGGRRKLESQAAACGVEVWSVDFD
jgi:hypothetical protein